MSKSAVRTASMSGSFYSFYTEQTERGIMKGLTAIIYKVIKLILETRLLWQDIYLYDSFS